jgi:hypothetical protein
VSPHRSAVSDSRFSDPKQAGGDSLDRQDREYRAFCQLHKLTPGKEVFADSGRAGNHGAHRTRDELGKLLDVAKDGRFDPGTVVVVEAWDRLGRLRPDRQTELVAELLRTGVSIGVCRLNDIFTEDDFGTHKWTTLAVFIQLAHQAVRVVGSVAVAAPDTSWRVLRRITRSRTGGDSDPRPCCCVSESVTSGKGIVSIPRATAARRRVAIGTPGCENVRVGCRGTSEYSSSSFLVQVGGRLGG